MLFRSGLVPGDTVQRVVNVENTGNQDFGSVALTTTSSTSNKLTTDTTNGLQVKIESCSSSWTEAGTAPAYTYTCSGTKKTVLAQRPIIGANMALSNLTSLTAGTQDHILTTVSLPSGSGTDNSFQDLSATIKFTFDATQRAATAK